MPNPDPLHSRWQENISRWSGVSEPDAVKQYRLDTRLIRLQERNRELTARRKRVPLSNGSRFLVTDYNQTAVLQSDDALEVLEYARNHDGIQVYDLDKEIDRRSAFQIGKYMAPRDRERAIVPQYNPDEGKAGRFGSPRESLLKDRKTVVKVPEPRDVTPKAVKLLNLVRHMLYGTPLIGKHQYTCESCGYATPCPCEKPRIRPADAPVLRVRVESSNSATNKPFIPRSLFNYEMRRKAGLPSLIPYAPDWICDVPKELV